MKIEIRGRGADDRRQTTDDRRSKAKCQMSEVRGPRFAHHGELRENGSAVRGQLVWLPSVVCRPLSVVRRLSSVFRLPSSPDCRPSSVVRRLSAGFTLVELLVVISIIAILLGVIVPSYFSIREKAKYTKAKVTVKNLETAFKAYLDQYRTWPVAFGAGADTEIDSSIVEILRGDQSSVNTVPIAFYEFESTNSTDGALDAWSDPSDSATWRRYHVQVDNYDNNITVGGQIIYRTVIVWSVGADRTNNTADDVKSWE